ncbi:MAG: ribosome maturation factor RimP [Actinobacteria bacterium]|nr:ribosome maturation factor RimP [Actinomycetota bacterium]
MIRAETVEAVRATCESVIASHDVELVDFVLTKSGRGQLLRITLDRPDGALPLGEIEGISRELSRALDLKDPIEGRYILEVSSAGLERPLTKPSDFSRFEGRLAKVKVREPIEGGKVFQGEIVSSNDETFVISSEDGMRVEIPYSSIVKANLQVDWSKELKGIREGK